MTLPPIEADLGGLVQLADYAAGSTFGPRQLDDFEIVWIIRGSALWTVENPAVTAGAGARQTYTLRPGSLVLARAGLVDFYQWDERRPSTHAYLHFEMPDLSGLPPVDTWPLVHELGGVPILTGLTDHLLQLAGVGGPSSVERTSQLIGLLVDLLVSGPLPTPQSQLPPPFDAVVEQVRRLWGDGTTSAVEIPHLAAAVGISVGHLHRRFRETYGCGPAHALELVRLSRTAVLLTRTNSGLQEIAAQGGFADPYHFSRRFSRLYKTPPGAYRRAIDRTDPLAPVRAAGLLAFYQRLAG